MTTPRNPPKTLAAAEESIRKMAELQRQLQHIELTLIEEITPIRDYYEKKSKPLKEKIEDLQVGLQFWAEKNKADLINGKTRTAKLATGEVGWRMSAATVHVAATNVIDSLKRLGLTKFIRTKEELDKNAILANPQGLESVKGLSIVREETFWVKPFGGVEWKTKYRPEDQ